MIYYDCHHGGCHFQILSLRNLVIHQWTQCLVLQSALARDYYYSHYHRYCSCCFYLLFLQKLV